MDNRHRDDLEDPLGISRTPVPKDNQIRAGHDEASVRRRRRRALETEPDDTRTIVGESDDPQGATGIDMGGGGDDTGIKRSR